MINIKDNLDKIKAQIAQACQQNNRLVDSVLLLAVSKTKPIEDIEQAYVAGQHHFGENYLQEALQKIEQLSHLPEIYWHYIGPIQSNKTKQIANNFSWVHSVDREKIALRLNDHLKESINEKQSHLTPLNICLQVNISEEKTKSGISPEQIFALADVVNQCENLTLRGLMAIPEKNARPEIYQKMAKLFIELRSRYESIDTLSLGMSNDLSLAVKHGSTMVRIGTAIFGQRNNK
ncbi:YggS family pyridoxal phosphate-dependent enzyme [Litorilituus lipolyticus]|uniref:Pyridoxal phosphate homeostasis protein n=1 Tax=Litorilituus lipolyticus TaxID=2491017 RepID=A0A502L1K6_9GAMM|nr:YggS family pyridoxal phosphate-dependent enzyme [Litorilituus lipolyticus]TPH16739.1 YggS family pyridoxal phosphate-dependent enzyme [Litorilituus lipolyticus]